MNIIWAASLPLWDTPDFYVKLRSGYSVMLSNRLTALKRQHPQEGVNLSHAIESLSERLSLPETRQARPNVPEMVHYHVCSAHSDMNIVLAWGIVTNGAKRGAQVTGEFRFIICLLEELDAALTSVFELERTLRIEKPAV